MNYPWSSLFFILIYLFSLYIKIIFRKFGLLISQVKLEHFKHELMYNPLT